MAGDECPSPPPTSLFFGLFTRKAKRALLPLAVGSQDRKDPEGRWSNLFVLELGTLRSRDRAYCSRSPSNSEVEPKVPTFNPASFLIWNVV